MNTKKQKLYIEYPLATKSSNIVWEQIGTIHGLERWLADYVEEVREGIIASKIAAHAADIAKGVPGARDQDDRMAAARRNLDWEAQYACALDPETARSLRESRLPEDDHSDTCSMCGKFCAVRSINKALAGELIDIL